MAVPWVPSGRAAARVVPRGAALPAVRRQAPPDAHQGEPGKADGPESWFPVVVLPATGSARVVTEAGAVHLASSAVAMVAVSRVGGATLDDWSPGPLLPDADWSDESPAVPPVDAEQLVPEVVPWSVLRPPGRPDELEPVREVELTAHRVPSGPRCATGYLGEPFDPLVVVALAAQPLVVEAESQPGVRQPLPLPPHDRSMRLRRPAARAQPREAPPSVSRWAALPQPVPPRL